MAGSYDQNVEGKFKTLDNNNAAPEGAITEVRDTPDKEVLKIIGEAQGKGKDVPSNFKSADGSDATIVAKKAGEQGAEAAGGEKTATKGQQEGVVEHKYEKHVVSTMGNDTQGSVKETVKAEAAKEKAAAKDEMEVKDKGDSKAAELGKQAAEGVLLGAEKGDKGKDGKDLGNKDKDDAEKEEAEGRGDKNKDGKADKDGDAEAAEGEKDAKDAAEDRKEADNEQEAEEKAKADAAEAKEHASEASGEHAKQKEANDPATANPHNKAAQTEGDAVVKKLLGG
jgi:hypothetical protein